MKILQLCKKYPYPLKDGESIAIDALARSLHQSGASVTLLAMNTSKHRAHSSHLEQNHDHYEAVHTVDIDNHIRPIEALSNLLFSNKSYHINRFDVAAFRHKLTELLLSEAYDVVQLETLYLAPYIDTIRKYSRAKIALRSHNVEFEIWERIAANSGSLKKWYLERITPRLRQYEISRLNHYDLIAAITQRDLEHFRHHGLDIPAIVTPIGIPTEEYTPDYSAYGRPMSLSFIGSLDWMPNIEGLQWFLYQVWAPLVAPRYPDLQLHIAGRNTPDWLKNLQMPGIIVHGETPSARKFINQHAISVAPLLSGGGMRAKILESMALGRLVISTTIGMEGIEARNGKEAILADTPEGFAEAIAWCVEHGDKIQETGESARAFCERQYDYLQIGRDLLEAYEGLLKPAAIPA